MKGPILHSKDYTYKGVVFPWYVFQPTREGVPELRYLANAIYIDDATNTRIIYKRKLPLSAYNTLG